MESIKIHADINLNGILGKLQSQLQSPINNVTLGLNSNSSIPDNYTKIPGVNFGVSFVRQKAVDKSQLETAFYDWVLINGFRDASESISNFLEEVYRVLSLWNLFDKQSLRKLTGEDWNELIVKKAKKFHRLGLPDKIDILQTHCNQTLDSSLIENILSINTARNCLVHRSGFVGTRDINSGKYLTVSWRKLSLVLMEESGESEIQVPQYIEEKSKISIRHNASSKKFKLHEKIVFTTQEFSDICWCLYLFGLETIQKIGKVGTEKGYLTENNKQ